MSDAHSPEVDFLHFFNSRDFEQIFGQIVSSRVKARSNTDLVASRYIKKEKGLLPVDARGSKTSLLELPPSRD